MISKRVLGPALTGTGAVGASGTLAWTLGLLDEESFEDVVDVKVDVAEPKPDQKENLPSSSASQADPEKPPEAKESKKDVPPNETRGGQKPQASAGAGNSSSTRTKQRTITHVSRTYFTNGEGASSVDKQVINSKLNLKVEWKKGLQSIIVNAEEVGEEKSWKCTIKAISIEEIYSDYDFKEFERQRGELEAALKDENNKNQFVANCSYTRLDGEKDKGEDSTIELETEKAGSWNKFKFKETDKYFERLWSEDFRGIDRVKKEDEWFLDKENVGHWSIKTEEEAKRTIKVTATLNKNKDNKKWSCNISRDSTNDPGTKTFKDDKLGEILKLSTLNSGRLEKKKFLIRNCSKNKGEIKGLKIKVDRSNWSFVEDSLEKITEGMYENPTET